MGMMEATADASGDGDADGSDAECNGDDGAAHAGGGDLGRAGGR